MTRRLVASRRVLAPSLGLLAALGLGFSVPAQARTLKAVASFTILADMVRTVGGTRSRSARSSVPTAIPTRSSRHPTTPAR